MTSKKKSWSAKIMLLPKMVFSMFEQQPHTTKSTAAWGLASSEVDFIVKAVKNNPNLRGALGKDPAERDRLTWTDWCVVSDFEMGDLNINIEECNINARNVRR